MMCPGLSPTILRVAAAVLGLVGVSPAIPVLAAPAASAPPELSVIDPPSEAPTAASFYVRVQIANRGTEPLHACDTSEGAPPPETACFAVAYRRDKRPPRLAFSRVEVAPVLARSLFVPPGETMERLVRIPTASRGTEQSVYLYLVTGGGGRFEWKEAPLQLRLGAPPAQVRRAIWSTRSLLAVYLALLALGIWWSVRRPPLAAS